MKHFLLFAAAAFVGTQLAACAVEGQPTAPAPYARWENGLPQDAAYFPIAVWLQDPKNAGRFQEAGINLYVALWQGPTEEQLAALKAAGMPVICAQNEVGLRHKDDKTIVAWMHGDEPDNAQSITDPATGKRSWGPCVPPDQIVADYEKMRVTDPTRPILLNLGQGVANDEWKGRGNGAHLGQYETFVKGGDIISFDVYPVAGIQKPDGENYLWYVPKGVDRLKQWAGGKRILWNCIECSQINDDTKPAPSHVRAEVWMALIHGSTGLIYFNHQFKPKFNEHALLDNPVMLAAVTALNKQIQSLAPVLNSPTVPDGAAVTSAAADVPIDVMVKQHDGATYLFAVGMRNGAAKGAFQVRGLPRTATAEVLGENRTVTVRNGRFEDDFQPYAVHLYRIR